MNQDHTTDPDDLAHHDDQPDRIDDLIDTLFAQHLRPPTLEEFTGVVTTADLLLGASLGFTARQARIIANNRDYLMRLTRAWNVYVPNSITEIARQDSAIGALHRTLLEATGHPLPQADIDLLTAGLDQELEWLVLEQLAGSGSGLRAAGSSADTQDATAGRGWTCVDTATGATITVSPATKGRWSTYLETNGTPLRGAVLYLHWTDDTITTHQIPDLGAVEEKLIPVDPPSPAARPDRASLHTPFEGSGTTS